MFLTNGIAGVTPRLPGRARGRRLVVTVAWVLLSTSTGFAMIYHLAPPPAGHDAHTGTAAQPWAGFGKAMAALQPGDTLLVQGGTYALTQSVQIACAGTSNAWITIAGAPGETAVLDADGYVPTLRESGGGAVCIQNAAFVRLQNLTIRNAHNAGIMLRGDKTRYIDILNCRVDRTYCPGIHVAHGEHIRVIGCEITEANRQDMRPPAAPRRHEAPHEALSIAGTRYFEVASNNVHHCAKEGIDVKETSAHGRVHHNHVHHVARQGLYVDAWFGLLEDVEFDHNVSEDNGFFGMAVSVECRDSLLRNVRIHHNLFRRNGGSGLFFSVWGVNGPRAQIDVRNNTIVNNGGHLAAWAGPTGGIDLKSRACRDIVIANNICAYNAQFEIATFDNPADGLAELAAHNIVITGNLSATAVDDTDHPSPYGRVYALPGAQAITGDPRFVNAAAGDFRICHDSPARITTAPGYAGAFSPAPHQTP